MKHNSIKAKNRETKLEIKYTTSATTNVDASVT